MDGNQVRQYIMEKYSPEVITHDANMLATLPGRATEEETSVHISCECEDLASLRHTHLGSFFLDPEDIRKLSIGAVWNFAKRTGLL
jgi:hypothetical protein